MVQNSCYFLDELRKQNPTPLVLYSREDAKAESILETKELSKKST